MQKVSLLQLITIGTKYQISNARAMNLIIWLRGKEIATERRFRRIKAILMLQTNKIYQIIYVRLQKMDPNDSNRAKIIVTALCNLRLNHAKNYTYLYHNIRFLKFKVYFHCVAYSLK